MTEICCNCVLWTSYDDGYGFCACDGETRFCTHKCAFLYPFEIEGWPYGDN